MSHESYRPRCGRCGIPFHHEPVPDAWTVGRTWPACDCPENFRGSQKDTEHEQDV